MDYKIVSLIIMNVAFWGYVIPMCAIYGIPVSISDTYYKLRRNLQVLFTLSMWGFAIPAIILGVETMHASSFLAFLAGAGIAFVGASPAFKSGTDAIHGVSTMEGIVHRTGALVGLIGSQLMILAMDGLPIVAASFILICVACLPKFRKKAIFIIELIAFLAVDIFYIIQIF